MAGQLQEVYAGLERTVRDKTAALQAEQKRLSALYEISAMVARAPNLEQLAQGFVGAVRRIADADAAALRWTDDTAQRYLLLASEGMPESFVGDERCLHAGTCHCGSAQPAQGVQVVHFGQMPAHAGAAEKAADSLCLRAGFATLTAVPIAVQGRLLGELDLFHRDRGVAQVQHKALLEALGEHLAAAMESLRGAALEREAAITRERTLLARELHDSIAQALVFMKIQLQLLRTALRAGETARVDAALAELDEGLRESTAHVRELLLHFRTRAQEQDIEPALRSTVQKFEAQTGLHVRLQFEGHGQPLDADVQIQVLHVVQEALSNVRKHARAHRVNIRVQSLPSWSFSIEDDGRGCDTQLLAADAQAHVGLQIMRERAAAIGAELAFESTPGQGARVCLSLPASPSQRPSAMAPLQV
ncbi:MAG: GAF domain-containing protein, partial [Betaproteobacteria bacterium]|nr:GAF domain-containing protein [Betaproteobacteria bacterium]